MTAADGRYVTLASATGWLGRSANVGDTDRDALVISDLLASVEYEIDTVCGTVFKPMAVSDLEVQIFSRARSLSIPYAQSVDSVSLDGEVLSGWSKSGKTDVTNPDPGFSRLRFDDGSRWDPGLYLLDGMFGYAEPPEMIKQAVNELVEFRYNTRNGIANVTGFGDVVIDGGRPYPSSVFAALRKFKRVESLVMVV